MNSEPSPVVRVGVASIITDPTVPGVVLVGRRKKSHGFNKYAFPGGHLEVRSFGVVSPSNCDFFQVGESWGECAQRETLEETNLTVGRSRFVGATNDTAMGGDPTKHYVTILMHSELLPSSSDLQNMEPEKCFSWEWRTWDELQTLRRNNPEELFEPLLNALDILKIPLEVTAAL
jgi:8-oxo-dGTP diphosphatase